VNDIQLDASLRLVSDGQRREILRLLRDDSAETMTVAALLDRLYDDGSTPPGDAREDREQLSIRLVHTESRRKPTTLVVGN